MSSGVLRENEVLLNSVRYPISGQVTRVLTSVFAPKQTIGDYSPTADPYVSTWHVNDHRGGILLEEMDITNPAHKNRAYWADCNLNNRGNVPLPRLATTLTTPTDLLIINADCESPEVWLGDGAWSSTEKHGGTYSWKHTNTGAGGQTHQSYQDLSNASYTLAGLKVTFKMWVYNTSGVQVGDGRIGINDGVGTTYSSYTATDDVWEQLTVTRTLDASATQIRLILESFDGATGSNFTYFDDATSPIIDIGTPNLAVNYNSKLYWAFGQTLCRLNASTGATWIPVKDMGATITALIPSLNNRLYVYLGDSTNYYYMDTTEAFTQSNSANAYWGFQWDSKLFKVNTSGTMTYSVDPDGAGPTWTASANITDIASQIETFFVGKDPSGDDIPYCATNSKFKVLDFTNSLWLDTALSLPDHPNGGKGAAYWRSGMYISNGLGIYEYIPSAPVVISEVGLNNDDSLPATYNGEVVKIYGGSNYELFAAIDASQVTGTQKSGLYAFDGLGWKCWWADSNNDAAMYDIIVSSAYGYRVYWGAGTSVLYADIPRGITNPKRITQTYAASGTLYTTWFDAGWSDASKIAVAVRVKSSGCSANETITPSYRLDHTYTDLTTGWTALTAISSNTTTTYTLASGAGLAFKSIQFKFALARGSTNTNSPNIEWYALSYIPTITTTSGNPAAWGYRFTIDTTQEYDGKSSRQLVAAIKTAAETTTLIPFVFHEETGTSETFYGRIQEVQGTEESGLNKRGHFTVFLIVP